MITGRVLIMESTKNKKLENGIDAETYDSVIKFRDDRDWRQFHNPKDLAVSISLEAAELLETFQWSGSDTSSTGKEDKLKEELADVLIYSMLMADACNFNLNEIVLKKIKTNSIKYPVDKAKGNSSKYDKL